MRTGHKTLTSMVEVASAHGESKRGNWLVEYSVKGVGLYKDLGYKKEEIKIGTYCIYHWGTLILEIEEHGNIIQGYRYHINKVYGQSVSDARAINAILDYFGIGGTRYTFKPVNGGFQSQY